MTWFKLDDKCAFHSKVIAAGNEAFGAWARAGSWSSGELLDGFVPEHMALTIGAARLWHRLETCGGPKRKGLAERVDGGWQIHDFEKYNPKSEQVRERRETTKKRVEEWRSKRSGESSRNGVANPTCNAVTHASGDGDVTPPPTRPDPSRPVPKGSDPPVVSPTGDQPKSKRARSVMTLIPPDWSPSESHFELAVSEGGRDRSWVDHEAAKMRDWAESRGKRYADWNAMFRTWIRRSMQEYPPPQGATPPPPTRQPEYPQHQPINPPPRMTQEQLRASAEASKQAKLQLDAMMGEMPDG